MKYDYKIHFSIQLSECEMLVVSTYMHTFAHVHAHSHTHTYTQQYTRYEIKKLSSSSNLKKPQLTTFLIKSKISDIHGLLHKYVQVTS